MPYGQILSDSITDSSGGVLAPSSSVFRNRLINADMRIDQRNAGASVTANDNVYPVDRFRFSMTQSSKGTGQQSTTAPTGFINSLLFTSSSAYSVLSTDTFTITQSIEGLNVSDLALGTASAATVTLSFWVRSSLTGTFGGSIQNSAGNRSYPFTYTINSANTFEQKSITIAGDTSGTWLTTNGIGIRVWLGLGVGSTYSGTAGTWAGANYQSATGATSVVGTNGATFYITGVQLEKGSTATSFDYRPYGTELALCQRYYEALTGSAYSAFASGLAQTTTAFGGCVTYSRKRTTPTLGYSALADFGVTSNLGLSGTITAPTSITSQGASESNCYVQAGLGSAALTAGTPSILVSNNNSNARLTFSAEL